MGLRSPVHFILMADSDDETPTGQYTIDDVLNDTSDFELDLPDMPPSKPEIVEGTVEATAPAPTPSSSLQVPISPSQLDSKVLGDEKSMASKPIARPVTPVV